MKFTSGEHITTIKKIIVLALKKTTQRKKP